MRTRTFFSSGCGIYHRGGVELGFSIQAVGSIGDKASHKLSDSRSFCTNGNEAQSRVDCKVEIVTPAWDNHCIAGGYYNDAEICDTVQPLFATFFIVPQLASSTWTMCSSVSV